MEELPTDIAIHVLPSLHPFIAVRSASISSDYDQIKVTPCRNSFRKLNFKNIANYFKRTRCMLRSWLFSFCKQYFIILYLSLIYLSLFYLSYFALEYVSRRGKTNETTYEIINETSANSFVR